MLIVIPNSKAKHGNKTCMSERVYNLYQACEVSDPYSAKVVDSSLITIIIVSNGLVVPSSVA